MWTPALCSEEETHTVLERQINEYIIIIFFNLKVCYHSKNQYSLTNSKM